MIGIIVAEPKELEQVILLSNSHETINIYNLTFYKLQIKDKECIVALSGMGKVNSARVTQIMIDNFDIEYIINLGVAGGISDKIKIGDIVVAERLVQYDYDLTAFGRELRRNLR